MKLAYSANAYMKFPIEHAIQHIADLGYRGIELMADVPHAWPPDCTPERIDAIRIEHTKRALTLARQLGAPNITTEPGGPVEDGMTREWALDTFVEELKPVLDHAEREGVDLLIEPEPALLIENADQFLELADRVDSPRFGLNFDVGHFYCVREALAPAVKRLEPYTRHYHIEDIAATRVHQHMIPGQGAIDFTEVFRAIRQTGYDGWVTVELYPYLDDPDAAGREAHAHVSKIIDAL